MAISSECKNDIPYDINAIAPYPDEPVSDNCLNSLQKQIQGNPVFCQADICLNHMTFYEIMPEYCATPLIRVDCHAFYITLSSYRGT